MLSAHGRSVDPRYVEGVSNYKKPTTKEEVQRFIGMVGFYGKFIPNFSSRVSGLRRHTLATGFIAPWSDEDERAFVDLKSALLFPPLLRTPDWSGESHEEQRSFRLTTYFSKTGMGAALEMVFEDGWHTLYFISRLTTEREARLLDPASGEACALVWALNKLRNCFAGRGLQVLTDHANLAFYAKLTKGDQVGKWEGGL